MGLDTLMPNHGGTSLTAQETGAVLVPRSEPRSVSIVGALISGIITGIAVLTLLVIWIRRRLIASGKVQVPRAVYGPGGGAPYNYAYNAGVVLPTIPRYTGLPEPQNGESTGSAGVTYAMPTPIHDIHQPRPLPMSVTPMQENATDARSWSGFGSRPSDGQNPTCNGDVEASYQSPRGRSSYDITNTNSAFSSTPGVSNTNGSAPPMQAPPTEHQLTSETGAHHNRGLYLPPASPLESPYPMAIAGNISGPPDGAAPPTTDFAGAEKPPG
ncbi:hypothetical protein RSOLAG1IB_08854 [Rhizoctonia solani AG-1 IB]|uniref:Uncharacterized protein n=1 Tax=Thanatephorus cucumeris (strain AG1-IB / isolate 7/3/14) TaxID=1108050 RepID=A0A0B7FMA8_THACB|nr:hypothetical protein RSOLAG1IB_08854 [Rhizoctonia solani AG-1 IB]